MPPAFELCAPVHRYGPGNLKICTKNAITVLWYFQPIRSRPATEYTMPIFFDCFFLLRDET